MKISECYYQKNAKEFFQDTIQVDMSSLRERFLTHVPLRGCILDAGCGSGRDAKAFIEASFQVTAFDAAPALAKLAQVYLGQVVDVLTFNQITYEKEFDAVWACASLLHVPNKSLPKVFLKLFRALKSGGVMYVSFKYGSGEVEHNGRRFTNMNEGDFSRLLEGIGVFKLMDTWVSNDRRPDRDDEKWFNALLISTGDVCHSA